MEKKGVGPGDGRGVSGKGSKAELGGRSTKARKLVVELFASSDDCLSVEEIRDHLRAAGGKLGLATVYRSVNFLSEAGSIARVEVGDGISRFEAAEKSGEDHHHHLVCLKCRRVMKYSHFSIEELDLMKKTQRRLEAQFGYRISGHRIVFEGICPECQ